MNAPCSELPYNISTMITPNIKNDEQSLWNYNFLSINLYFLSEGPTFDDNTVEEHKLHNNIIKALFYTFNFFLQIDLFSFMRNMFWVTIKTMDDIQTSRLNPLMHGHPQQKVLRGQEFSGMGCLKVFWVKGKKTAQRINMLTDLLSFLCIGGIKSCLFYRVQLYYISR